jgi:hypothetical protein
MRSVDPNRIWIVGVAGSAEGKLVLTGAKDEQVGEQIPKVLGVKRPGSQREKQKHEKAWHSSSESGVTEEATNLAGNIWESHYEDGA